jgi:hypothetical protein
MTDYIDIDPFAFRTGNEAGAPTWGDYAREIGASVQGVRGALAELGSYTAGKRGEQTLSELMTLQARQLRSSADDIRDGRSEAAKRASDASPLEGEFWKHPIRSTALKVTSSLSYTAAIAIPAGIVGASLGALPGMAAGAAVASSLGAGNLLSDVMERVDAADDATLKRDSAYYSGLRERMPEEQARLEFRNYMVEGDGRLTIAALAEAAQGIFGVGGMAARLAAGRPAVLGAKDRGLLGRMGVAGATEGAVETGQESTSNLVKQYSLMAGGLQKEFELKEWASAAVEGLIIGGTLGAAFGVPRGRRRGEEQPPISVPAQNAVQSGAIDPAQAAAIQANAPPAPPPAPTPAPPPVANPPGNVAARPPVPPDVQNTAQTMGLDEQRAASAQPLDGSEPTVPEPRVQLAAQVQELAEGSRDVVMIPKGTPVPKKPKGLKYTQVAGVGVFYHRDNVSSDEIRAAVKEGRINELLKMGPTTKEEAAADVQQGADPLVVQVRNEEGVPTTEAASSSATVAQDASAIAEQATPGSTIQLTAPEQALAERVMRREQEQEALDSATKTELKIDQPVTPPSGRGRQVLRDIEERKRQLDDAARGEFPPGYLEEAAAADAPVTPPVTSPVTPRGPGQVLEDTTPLEQKPAVEREAAQRREEYQKRAIEEDKNAEARQKNKITDDFKADEKPFFRRMQAIVDGKAEGDKQSAGAALKLRDKRTASKRADKPKVTEQIRMIQQAEYEARRAAEAKKEPPAPNKIGRPKNEEPATSEEDARDKELARLEREQKQDAKSDATGVDLYARGSVGMGAAEVSTDVARSTAPKNDEKTSALDEQVKNDDDLARAKDTGPENTAVTASARSQPKIDAEVERRVIRTKDGKEVEVEAAKAASPVTRPKLSPEELAAILASANERRARLRDGEAVASNGERDIPLQTTTLTKFSKAVAQMRRGPIDGMNRLTTILFGNRMRELAGRTPVHIVDGNSPLLVVNGRLAEAVYDPGTDQIFIAADIANDPVAATRAWIHEGAHAAYHEGIEADPTVKRLLERVIDVAIEQGVDPKTYGLTDAHELVSETIANDDLKIELSTVILKPSTKAALEREFGPLHPDVKSLWDVIVDAFRRIMKMKPDQFTALDAVLRITATLDSRREAAGRASRPPTSSAQPLARMRMPSQARVNDLIRPIRKVLFGGASNTMLAMHAERFGDAFGRLARKADELSKRMATFRNDHLRRKGGTEDVTREGDLLQQKYGEKFAEAMAVGFEASAQRLSLSKKGQPDRNKFVGDRMVDWQRKARIKDLQPRFQALPEELQDWLIKAADFGRTEGQATARKAIETLLNTAGIRTAGLVDRILRGQTTDIDEKQFKTDDLFNHAKRLANEFRKQGWYFPFNREGDFVVNARMKVEVPAGSHVLAVEPNVIQFVDPTGKGGDKGALRAAKAFSKASRLDQLDAAKVWVDKNNPSKTIDSSDVNAIPAYRVTVQDQFTAMRMTEAEAAQVAEEATAQGLLDVRLDKKKLNPQGNWGGLMPSQYEAMISSLRSRQGFKDLSEKEQNELIQAMHQANLRLLPGNRLQHHKLQRRNVAGQSQDLVRSLAQYGQQNAAYLAKMEYQPRIDEAFKGMKEEIQRLNDKDNVRRQELLTELETRIYSSLDNRSDGLVDNAIYRLNQISMLNKLPGFSYNAINATEPWLILAPLLAGRHSPVRIVKALGNAYGLIGAKGALGAGLQDTVRAWSQNRDFTDYRSYIKDEIRSNAGNPERATRLTQVIDYLYERQLFGADAGMEIQRVANPTYNMVGKAIDRADLIARQVTQAGEAINRSVGALAAYELEYSRNGRDHEAALRYAHDMVHDASGNYSAENAPPIFNNTFGRLTLQFMKFPQRMYYILGKSFGAMLRGDREGARQFVGLMFTHGVAAGLLGLPLEPIKAALIAGGFLGMGLSYDDFEELVYSTVAGFSPTFAEIATRGVPRAAGIDISGRVGLDGLLTFGEPRSARQNDLKSWLFDTIAGAPISTIMNVGVASTRALEGDALGALEKAPIPKAAIDLVRATKGAIYGKESQTGRQTMEPYTPYETVVKGLGFAPARESREREARNFLQNNIRADEEQRKRFRQAWIKATPDERAKLWGKVEQWNKTKPKDAQLTRRQLEDARRRRDNEETVLGAVPNRRNQYIFDEMQRLYRVN